LVGLEERGRQLAQGPVEPAEELAGVCRLAIQCQADAEPEFRVVLEE
jgi:hypothetical protein